MCCSEKPNRVLFALSILRLGSPDWGNRVGIAEGYVGDGPTRPTGLTGPTGPTAGISPANFHIDRFLNSGDLFEVLNFFEAHWAEQMAGGKHEHSVFGPNVRAQDHSDLEIFDGQRNFPAAVPGIG